MKFSNTNLMTILLLVTLLNQFNTKVIPKKNQKLFNNSKSFKDSSPKLSDNSHPSRYLKEEKFMPRIPAKLKLFMHEKIPNKFEAPGKIIIEYQSNKYLNKHIFIYLKLINS